MKLPKGISTTDAEGAFRNMAATNRMARAIQEINAAAESLRQLDVKVEWRTGYTQVWVHLTRMVNITPEGDVKR